MKKLISILAASGLIAGVVVAADLKDLSADKYAEPTGLSKAMELIASQTNLVKNPQGYEMKFNFYQVANGTAQQTLTGFTGVLGAFAAYQGNSPSNSTVAAYFKGATNVTLTSSTGVTNAVNLLIVGY